MRTAKRPTKKEAAPPTEQELIADLVEILHSDEAIALQRELNTFNPFYVLRVSDYEIRHTNTLAWLLEPHQSHGLGDAFLRAFIANLPAPNNSLKLSQLFETSPHAPAVMREVNLGNGKLRLDLLITDRETWAIAIEAKINARQGDNQLENYSEALHSEAFSVWGGKQIALTKIYLTIYDDEPADTNNEWQNATWAENVCVPLERTIKPLLKNPGALSPALQFITYYINTLNQIASPSGDINSLVESLARKFKDKLKLIKNADLSEKPRLAAILNRHSDVLEKLTSAVESSVSGRAEVLKPILVTNGFYVPVEKNSYMPFIPKEWNAASSIKRCITGGPPKDPFLVGFVISNRIDRVGLYLELKNLGEDATDEMANFRRAVVRLGYSSKKYRAFPSAFSGKNKQPRDHRDSFFKIYSDYEVIDGSEGQIKIALETLLQRLSVAGTVDAFATIIDCAMRDVLN